MSDPLNKFIPADTTECGTLSGSELIFSLTGSAELFIFSYSPKYQSLISWTKNAKKILGVKDVSIAHDSNLFLRHVHPDDRYLLLTDLELALKGQSPYRATYRWIRPDTNELRWLHCRAGLTKTGEQDLLEGIIMDLSSEFTGEIGKLAGPDSVSAILAAFPTVVFTADRDLRLQRINRSNNITLFDFGDPGFIADNFRIGRSLLDAFSNQRIKYEYSEIFTELLEEKSKHYRKRISANNLVFNLEIIPLKNRGVIDGLLFNVSDVTDSVRLENQLSQLKKFEGLGLLAEGVAHNFNNALQAILGQASILVNHAGNTELVQKAGQAIIDTVTKSSGLTQQLVRLNEKSPGFSAPVDLNLVAMAAVNNIQDIFSDGIKIAVTFGNLSKVEAEQNQLAEAVEAVLRNAKESLNACSSGTPYISIKSQQVVLKDMEIADLKGGVYALLTVTDSGPGMSEETKERCFDPFFTTKERDPVTGVGVKAPGLGLPKAFSIIRKYRGSIVVDSKQGFGTKVSIYLPVESKDLAITPDLKAETARVNEPSIMVVDDDGMVLKTIERMLIDLGYTCVVAQDSRSALNLLKTYESSLQIILLDAVMPGMDGAAVLKQIRKINKKVKVIGFSGAAPQQTKPLLKNGALAVLRKPIGPDRLERAIKSALSGGQLAVNT